MGTIRLKRGATVVDFTTDLEVQRSVGRPGSELFRKPGAAPIYIDNKRAFSDVFELSGVLADDGRTVAKRLREEVLRDPLGTGALELEFVGTLWGLSTYQVVPVGNRAGRITWNTGEKDMARVDNLALRVVQG